MLLICRVIVIFLKLILIFYVIETKESVSMLIVRKGVCFLYFFCFRFKKFIDLVRI